MTKLVEPVQAQLLQAGYSVAIEDGGNGQFAIFENDTILGFVLFFSNATVLIERWEAASQRILRAAQLALRRAEAKSWNVYLVLLADERGDYGQSITLSRIEEDLVGTRKIARAGVANAEHIREALLPLTPIQTAPRMEAISMPEEVRLRTTELPPGLIEAFLTRSTEAAIAQLLEAGQ